MFLTYRSSKSRFLASAFDSAFFSRRSKNLTDFSGQRPVNNKVDKHKAQKNAGWMGMTLRGFELFCLASTTNTAIETTEGYALFVLLNITEEGVCFGELHT